MGDRERAAIIPDRPFPATNLASDSLQVKLFATSVGSVSTMKAIPGILVKCYWLARSGTCYDTGSKC
jgi:hypothetical protein